MTWFMNLHTLPPGKHMYTAWVTYDPVGAIEAADEIDFIASSRWDTDSLMRECAETREYRELYPDARIVAIADQSIGEKVYAEIGVT